jgi:predicted LPLAT superfamily acyltransferase
MQHSNRLLQLKEQFTHLVDLEREAFLQDFERLAKKKPDALERDVYSLLLEFCDNLGDAIDR